MSLRMLASASLHDQARDILEIGKTQTRAVIAAGQHKLGEMSSLAFSKVTEAYEFTANKAEHTYAVARQRIVTHLNAAQKTIYSNWTKVADAVKDFVYENRFLLLFGAVSAITAYFSPVLFFTATVIGIVGRVGITQFMRDNLREDSQYYPRSFEGCRISSTDIATSLIGTFGTTGSWALYAMYGISPLAAVVSPILGGLALGNVVAKGGMDLLGQIQRLRPAEFYTHIGNE